MKRFRTPLVLALAFVLAGSGLAQTSGGVLRVGMQADPVGLDPHITNATSMRNMLENVYDTLVMFDSSLRSVPGLATSWTTSEDGLTWTFDIRQGVAFHDGTPLTADDVVFSIERIKDPATASPRADSFSVVESVVASDDHTVVMTLSAPSRRCSRSWPGA